MKQVEIKLLQINLTLGSLLTSIDLYFYLNLCCYILVCLQICDPICENLTYVVQNRFYKDLSTGHNLAMITSICEPGYVPSCLISCEE